MPQTLSRGSARQPARGRHCRCRVSSGPVCQWMVKTSVLRVRTLAYGGWLLLSGLAVVRLVTSPVPWSRAWCAGLDCWTNGHSLPRRAAAGARLGVIVVPELRVSSRRALPIDLVLGSPARDRLAEDAAAATLRSTGSACFATSWRTGCAGTTGRACSARCWSVPCPGTRWRGWPGIAWVSSASWLATIGCSRPVCRPRIMPSRSLGLVPQRRGPWHWRRSRAVADCLAGFGTSSTSGAAARWLAGAGPA